MVRGQSAKLVHTGSNPVHGSNMICLKTFVIKCKKDFDNIKDWCIFVNENYKYGNTTSTVWDWKHKCKESDLPSYHPYWSMLVWKDTKSRLKWIEDRYEECVKDHNKIKYYFNSSKKLSQIEDDIKNYKNKIKNLEQKIRY